MNIAIVLNTSWNVFNFRMGLIKALQSAGHQVTVVAPSDEYTEKLIELGYTHEEVKLDSRGANLIKDLGLIFELISIYKRIKPDVVLHYTIKPNIYGTIAAKVNGIPAINNVCGLGTVFLKKSFVTKIVSLLYKVSFRFANTVFFQNQDDLNLFLKEKLVKKHVADILPGSGVDTQKFSVEKFKRNKSFTFLLISRLIYDKGILEFIDAIDILKKKNVDAKFKVLGAKDPKHARGIKEELIDQWVNQNKFEYLGTTDDVRSLIQDSDCVVLPSYREGTPRTLLEAASSAKPIVTTDVPGCKDVVSHGYNGLLCEAKNSEDLAEKMLQMTQFENEKLKRLGENGRAKIEANYSEKLVIEKYIKTIGKLSD